MHTFSATAFKNAVKMSNGIGLKFSQYLPNQNLSSLTNQELKGWQGLFNKAISLQNLEPYNLKSMARYLHIRNLDNSNMQSDGKL